MRNCMLTTINISSVQNFLKGNVGHMKFFRHWMHKKHQFAIRSGDSTEFFLFLSFFSFVRTLVSNKRINPGKQLGGS